MATPIIIIEFVRMRQVGTQAVPPSTALLHLFLFLGLASKQHM